MTERRLKLWEDFASTFLFGARCSTSPWHEIYCKVQHVKMFYNLATCVQKMTIRANWHCVLHCMSPDSALVWPFLEKNNHQHTHTHTHTHTHKHWKDWVRQDAYDMSHQKDTHSHSPGVDFHSGFFGQAEGLQRVSVLYMCSTLRTWT